jgi:hypothetical protein
MLKPAQLNSFTHLSAQLVLHGRTSRGCSIVRGSMAVPRATAPRLLQCQPCSHIPPLPAAKSVPTASMEHSQSLASYWSRVRNIISPLVPIGHTFTIHADNCMFHWLPQATVTTPVAALGQQQARHQTGTFSVPGFLLVTRSEFLSPLLPIGHTFAIHANNCNEAF